MTTPDEMNTMQRWLDNIRGALRLIRDQATELNHSFGLPTHANAEFVAAIDSLIALDQYRRRQIGWAAQNPYDSLAFKEFKRREKSNHRTVLEYLGRLRETAHSSRRADIVQRLDATILAMASIPRREKELYRARRDWGRRIVADTRGAYSLGAANQIEGIARSGGQSLRLHLEHISTERYATHQLSGILQAGQRAAISQHFGTAVCDEYACYAMTEAYRLLPGTLVTVVAFAEVHVGLVIGPVNHPESVHVDAWTPRRSVTGSDSYGMKDIETGRVLYQGIADGRDLREEARSYIHPLPDLPPTVPSITVREAVHLVHRLAEHDPEILENIFHVTRGSDGCNSDSGPDDIPAEGHTLSVEAFTAHAGNEFLIESQEEQGIYLDAARVSEKTLAASMRTASLPSGTPSQPMDTAVTSGEEAVCYVPRHDAHRR
ncbi:hypothetical protein ACIBQ5_36670 [Streptomyces massasporeus]|uniref:hypothetical protein n=1 Tax=Streptomyces massasporeus TaxID=67324 RepID=UPI0037A1B05E